MRPPLRSGLFTLVALAACVLASVYRSQRPPAIAATDLLGAPAPIPELADTTTRIPGVPPATVPAAAHPASSERRHPYLHETITRAADGRAVVTNPTATEVVVNKERALPDGYVPADLVYPNVPFSFRERIEKRMLRRDAAEALERLFAAATRDGIRLVGISGYRSFATQRAIFARQVRTKGELEAARVSAYPGRSEHQTGLAIDLSSASANYALDASFGQSGEGRWLARNAPRFGFIIRYPAGREAATGYIHEPWHIRFVGVELAGEIVASGLTLEEYFANQSPAERRVALAPSGEVRDEARGQKARGR